MKSLEAIPKGTIGWKNRRLEILILETLERATVPHCKHRMWQKLQRKVTASYDDIYNAMARLELRGYLIHCGLDDEGESIFQLF